MSEYLPLLGVIKGWEDVAAGWEDEGYFGKLYGAVDDGTFHIGEMLDDTAAKTVYCKKCNGKHFNVGQSTYSTAIKCVTCGWEYIIHNG